MMRGLLCVAALVTVASSFVYTCNEIKRILESDDDFFVNATRACVVLPADVTFPYNDEPYTSYLWNTYLVDTGSAELPNDLIGILEQPTKCIEGVGPWKIQSDKPDDFKCSSTKFKYTEIAFIFTSDEPNIVLSTVTPTKATYAAGTHTFVTFEGSLLIDKNGVADGKETTFQLYAGAGQGEPEERFALMPEKFVAGTSTVVLGPVTTLVVEDGVTVDLTITAFDDEMFISAQPGYSYSVMTTGRASDYQSARPSILVSTHFGINDETIAYDDIAVTGTVFMDDALSTVLSIDCSSEETGELPAKNIDKTSDVIINSKCTALGITYKGSIAAADIDRSSEVIYLRVESSADPVHKTTVDPNATEKTTEKTDPVPKTTVDPDATTEKTRRTLPPTSPASTRAPVPTTTASRLTTASTAKTTTSGAAGVSLMVSMIVVAMMMV